MQRRVKGFLAGGVVAGLVAVGGVVWVNTRGTSAPSYRTLVAERRDLPKLVTAAGSIAVPARMSLGFAGSGRLTKVLVEPGDTVKKGQLLARIDPAEARLDLQKALAEEAAAKARLTSAMAKRSPAAARLDTATVAQNRTKADSAAAALDRARELADANEQVARAAVEVAQRRVDRAAAERDAAVTALRKAPTEERAAAQTRVDTARTALAEARDGVTTAEQNLAQTRSQGAQATGQAQAELDDARAALAVAQAQSDANAASTSGGAVAEARANYDAARTSTRKTRLAVRETDLVAPAAGTIVKVNGRVGERPGAAGSPEPAGSGATATAAAAAEPTPFITLMIAGPLELRANVVEADAVLLKPAQVAAVTLDARPEAKITARVLAVDATPTLINNVVNYGVRLAVQGTLPAGLRPGMTASLDITVELRRKVLVVPVAAVRQTDGQPVVQIPGLEGGPPVDRAVELGSRSGEFVEVVSGVDEGAAVVVPGEGSPAA